MTLLLNIALPICIVATLAMLGTRRILACALWSGVQGLAVGALPIFLNHEPFSLRIGGLVAGQLVLKGVVFPWLLVRLSKRHAVSADPASYVGFSGAVLLGLAALALSSWLAFQVGGPASTVPYMESFFLILAGLMLIVLRQKAVMQVIGYLTLENGIYVFGSAAVIGTPLLVELGVLLDVFVAVFVMGLAIDYIHLQFASTDVGQLSRLKG